MDNLSIPRLIYTITRRLYSRGKRREREKRTTRKPCHDGLDERHYPGYKCSVGRLTPVIDGPYPLAKRPEAMATFGRGEHPGEIVIIP